MSGTTDKVPDELLARFAPGVKASKRAAVRGAVGASLKRRLPLPGLELLRVDRPVGVTIRALEREGAVLYAEPNYVYSIEANPNDPRFGQLWGLHNIGQTVEGQAGTADADIDAPETWNAVTGASGVKVAVLDTGVAYDHPDLSGNIWSNPGETPNGVDDDGNGYIDDTRGWDWVNDDNDPYDYNGHGTHVSGTIGAMGNNGVGTTGVAWDVSIMPLRVLNTMGSGTTADIVSAFAYASSQGADVVNASLGGSGYSQSMADVISGAPGTLFVVAAGNSNSDDDVTPTYPCNYPAANLACVAATDNKDVRASFSNYGATSVDLAAPGVSILSTVRPALSRFFDNFNDSNLDGWLTGGTRQWGIESDADGPFASDSPGMSYAANTDSWLQTPAMNFSGVEGCKVGFWLNLDTEQGHDPFAIEASTNGTTWTGVDEWWGYSGGWVPMESSLEQYDGASAVYLRFRLRSDDSLNSDGVGIDDVNVECTGGGYSGDEYSYQDGTSMATPHVAGAAAVLFAASPSATTSAVRTALISGSDPNTSLAGKSVSGGRLNLKKALDLIAPPPGSVAFSSATYSVAEDAGSMTVTVDRSSSSTGPAQVDFATSPGTASAGSDYTTASGTLSFAAGQTSNTFTVRITDDTAFEGNETVQLALSSPVGATLGAQSTATLTITDNDTPAQVSFAQGARTVKEDSGVVQLNLNRSGTTGVPATVHYALTGGSAIAGSDFVLADGTATFAAGQTTQTVPLVVRNDVTREAGETIQLTLNSPGPGTVLAAPSVMTVTIAASDQRPDGLISTAASAGYVGNNVYNTTGAGQTKTWSARRKGTRAFYVRVANDGNVTNPFTVRGSAAATGSTVRYFIGATEITSSMRSRAGWRVTLRPGAFTTVRMQVKILRTARIRSLKTGTVTATWTGDGTRTDLVRGIVRVVR